MTRSFLLSAAACVLAIGGLAGQALAAPAQAHKIPPLAFHAPRSLAAQSQNSIVGTWLTSYDGGNVNTFTQWHKDKTTSQIIGFAAKTGNAQLGDYAKNEDGSYSLFLTGWSFDNKGNNLTGYFTKSETDTPSGDSYSGTFEVTFYDLDGNILFQHDGTLTAVRVSSQ